MAPLGHNVQSILSQRCVWMCRELNWNWSQVVMAKMFDYIVGLQNNELESSSSGMSKKKDLETHFDLFSARPTICGLPFSIHTYHDDVIKWKHFPRYWPFVPGNHRSPVNSPHKGQWRGALVFSLICVWINGWVNNREAGDLRRYLVHYDVTVMIRPVIDTVS